MKKNQVPLWPLYVADALLLLPVLAVVVPSIAGGGQPSGGALFLCTLAVLAGMVLALVPFALDYKIQSDQKRERADENQKNFEIIFDDLSSLRLSLAELVERVENNEALTADLPALSKGLSDLRDGTKQKFFEAAESADSIAAGLSKTESAQKALKTSVEEIGADIVVLKPNNFSPQRKTAPKFRPKRRPPNPTNPPPTAKRKPNPSRPQKSSRAA